MKLRTRSRAWRVAGGALVCGGVVWAALRFGVPAFLTDENHHARPALEALSWIAGIAGLFVAVVALAVAVRQGRDRTDVPETVTPEASATATHGGVIFTGNVTGGSGSGPTTGVRVGPDNGPPGPSRADAAPGQATSATPPQATSAVAISGSVTSVGGAAIGAMQGTFVQGDLVISGSRVPAMESIQAPPGLGKVPAGSDLFVGRSRELERLDATIAESDRAVVVAIHGLGGVGKSTLAAHFARRFTDRYTLVWWVTADAPTAIDTGLADLATTLAPETAGLPLEQRVELGTRWLATHDGWLLVLDNLATPADAAGLLERVRTGTIVITSRQGGGWRGVDTISLDVLLPEEAVELLARIVYAEWPGADMTDADRLCAELGWLPLAVEQAGAYIAQARVNPTAYLGLLARYPARMFTATSEGSDAQRTMARVWHVTLDRLANIPLAGQMLRLLAWYAPNAVPRALLAAVTDEPDLSDALGRLAAFSMVTLTADTIIVHRLVQAVSRTPDATDPHRQLEDINVARDTAAAGIVATLEQHHPSDPASWLTYQAILPHARALFDYRWPNPDTPAVCRLLDVLDRFVDALATQLSTDLTLISQGKPKEALANINALLPILDARLDELHPTVLRERFAQGMAYFQLASFDKAVDALEQAHRGQLVALGIAHSETLRTQFEYAMALKLRGRNGDVQHANTLLDEVRAQSAAGNGDDLYGQAAVASTLARFAPASLLRIAHRANHEHMWD